MYELKKGDRVLITKPPEKDIGEPGWVSDMDHYDTKEYILKRQEGLYWVLESAGDYPWKFSEDWMTKIEAAMEIKIKIGQLWGRKESTEWITIMNIHENTITSKESLKGCSSWSKDYLNAHFVLLNPNETLNNLKTKETSMIIKTTVPAKLAKELNKNLLRQIEFNLIDNKLELRERGAKVIQDAIIEQEFAKKALEAEALRLEAEYKKENK